MDCKVDFADVAEEYDPLMFSNDDIDEEEMDDDNPYDIVDYPMMRDMPEGMQREAVFSPEHQGGAAEALRALIDHNPARRDVLLAIIDACCGGCLTSEVTRRVDEVQKDNRSVYSAVTLCTMLQNAGALTFEMPGAACEREDAETGAEYLEITEEADPAWTSSPEALAVLEEYSGGAQFWDIMERDGAYKEVYQAVLPFVGQKPRSIGEISALVDTFEVVQSPRRFGGHFVDMLERVGASAWKDGAWTITQLGEDVMPQLEAAR